MSRFWSKVRSVELVSGLLQVAGALLLPGIALAAEPACSELGTRWHGSYVSDFHVAWDTTQFVCPGQEGILALALYDLQGSDFRPNNAGYRPDFYQAVKRDIRAMRYDPDCKYLATGARRSGTMTICPAFFTDSREDRASTLVHESRHLQAGDPSHVDCVGGKYNGDTGACDDTFYDGAWNGSGFNADVYFMNWHIKAGTSNELSQSVLQSYINSFVPDRFNHITPEQVAKWRAN